MKVVDMNTLMPEQQRSAQREAEILSQLRHPAIIEYIGHERTIDKKRGLDTFTLFIELCTCSLETQLQKIAKQERPDFSDKEKWTIAHQICSALQYLHTSDPQILHRDIKSGNVLLNLGRNDNVIDVRLADFGLCGVGPKNAKHVSVIGSRRWMAPEVFNRNYNAKCDGKKLLQQATHT